MKTPKQITNRICRKFDITIVRTSGWINVFRKWAALRVLKRMGLPHPSNLLAERTIFIALGKKRFIFTPRDNFGNKKRDLITLAHELCHLHQNIGMGRVRYLARYAAPTGRASLEGEAYAAGKKMAKALNMWYDPKFDDGFRRIYGVKPEHADVARDVYNRRIPSPWVPKGVGAILEEME